MQIPSLELILNQTRDKALDVTLGGKKEVVREWNIGQVRTFHLKDHYPSYGPLDLKRWTTATEPYEVEYSTYFEPYIIIARSMCPYYDERFRGLFGRSHKCFCCMAVQFP